MVRYRKLGMVGLGVFMVSGCGLSSSAPHNTRASAPMPVTSQERTTSGQTAHPSQSLQSPPKLTSSTLPQAFPSYSLVVSTVGRYLAETAQVPLYLPTLGRSYNHTSINVLYSLKGGGYRLTLGGGPPLPANSPKIGFGNAEYIYTVRGLPWSSVFQSRYLPVDPKPAVTESGPVIFGSRDNRSELSSSESTHTRTPAIHVDHLARRWMELQPLWDRNTVSRCGR